MKQKTLKQKKKYTTIKLTKEDSAFLEKIREQLEIRSKTIAINRIIKAHKKFLSLEDLK